eukprot:1161345-Pelagomonas_calceolata.AAC.15
MYFRDIPEDHLKQVTSNINSARPLFNRTGSLQCNTPGKEHTYHHPPCCFLRALSRAACSELFKNMASTCRFSTVHTGLLETVASICPSTMSTVHRGGRACSTDNKAAGVKLATR